MRRTSARTHSVSFLSSHCGFEKKHFSLQGGATASESLGDGDEFLGSGVGGDAGGWRVRVRPRRRRAKRRGELHAGLGVLPRGSRGHRSRRGAGAVEHGVELGLDTLVDLLQLEVPLDVLLLPKLELRHLVLQPSRCRRRRAKSFVTLLILLDDLHVK